MRRLALVTLCCLLVGGCTQLSQLQALRNVDFSIDGVQQANLAGVDLSGIQRASDVRPTDLLRLGQAASGGSLPLQFNLMLGADNPNSNATARMVELDWTLFLQDRETVSGVFNKQVVLPAGQRSVVPIGIQLDLVDFFGSNISELLNIATALAGQETPGPSTIRLVATPTIQTPIGPIRYPNPITIINREVGGSER
jgi:hypothetical protein